MGWLIIAIIVLVGIRFVVFLKKEKDAEKKLLESSRLSKRKNAESMKTAMLTTVMKLQESILDIQDKLNQADQEFTERAFNP